MKPTAPYSISGEAGKALGLQQVPLELLGIYSAGLTLRSLEVDTLTFSIIGVAGRIIPDDGQWLSLYDNTGTRLFTGIGKRTYQHPQGIYTYEVSNVYLGMRQTNLLSSIGRPFVTYDQGDLRARLRSVVTAATAAGLPVQAPELVDMPDFFDVPKCAFRSATLASALEDTCKWAPDVATSMDYSVDPPMLRFFTRANANPFSIDLSSDDNHVTTCQLTAFPEARALSIAFVYAERDGASVVNYRVQQAGNDSAEARRKTSIYLSGIERTDLLVSEAVSSSNSALATANSALAASNAAIAAVNAQISADYAAALAAIPGTSDTFNAVSYLIANDSALAAYPSLGWSSGGTVGGWNGAGWGSNTYQYTFNSYTKTGILYSNSGWPVAGNPFTAAQLAAAGATSTAGTITGNVVAQYGSSGSYGFPSWCSYYGQGTNYSSQAAAEADYYRWLYHPVSQSVNYLSKAPSVIRAALTAAAAATQAASTVTAAVGNTAFIDRAEFVTAPADLATNYFARQDWTPYKGSLVLDPQAPDFPAPGSFVNVAAASTPDEWAAMKAPVSELQLDLATGAATVTLGPPARMDFQSLIDRLRIPIEDNYQAG